MKAVIDTNVLVSGLIKQGTPPAEVLSDLMSGVLVVLYDQRILEEYRDVLARPRLKLAPEKVEVLLEFIAVDGVEVVDQPFVDVAFTGGAEVLITGNTRDFPVGPAIRVVTPREWVESRKNQDEP